MGILVLIILILDALTFGKTFATFKRNLTDMYLNLKYGFPKEPDVIYVRAKKPKPKPKPQRPKTAVNVGVGMFKVQVSRPTYYKARNRLVSARKLRGEPPPPSSRKREQIVEEEDDNEPLSLDLGQDAGSQDSIMGSPRNLDSLSSLVSPRDVDMSNIMTPRSARPSYYQDK